MSVPSIASSPTTSVMQLGRHGQFYQVDHTPKVYSCTSTSSRCIGEYTAICWYKVCVANSTHNTYTYVYSPVQQLLVYSQYIYICICTGRVSMTMNSRCRTTLPCFGSRWLCGSKQTLTCLVGISPLPLFSSVQVYWHQICLFDFFSHRLWAVEWAMGGRHLPPSRPTGATYAIHVLLFPISHIHADISHSVMFPCRYCWPEKPDAHVPKTSLQHPQFWQWPYPLLWAHNHHHKCKPAVLIPRSSQVTSFPDPCPAFCHWLYWLCATNNGNRVGTRLPVHHKCSYTCMNTACSWLNLFSGYSHRRKCS